MRSIKFGLTLNNQSTRRVIEQGVLADQLGFDTIWSGDHFLRFGENVDAFTALTAVALNTKKVTVSTGVTDPYRRHPATIAHTIASMHRISKGRVNLGLGAGELMNLTPFGIDWDHPIARLRESIEVIRMLWKSSSENPVHYNGQHYKLEGAYLTRFPLEDPCPKIYVGALGPKTRRLAGQYGDGYYSFIATPDLYKRNAGDVSEGIGISRRPIGDFDMVVQTWVAIGKEREGAFKIADPRVRPTLVLEGTTLRHEGYDCLTDYTVPVNRLLFTGQQMKQLQEAADKIPEYIVRKAAVYGSADDVAESIRGFINAGATHIVMNICNPDFAETIRIIADQVIPKIRIGN